MKITSAHDAGVGERRGCFMKRVMAFIICIMFGRTSFLACEDVRQIRTALLRYAAYLPL
jgi:hypothetical protein